MQLEIHILTEPEDVARFVADARTASDSEKGSLGFLPERAYREAADQGKLLIATVRHGKRVVYAGHLLHGGVFPVARIFQIYVAPKFRCKGIGRRLVGAIIRQAEQIQFMNVVARVGADLKANEFWDSLGFQTVRTVQGGRTTGRQINIRVRDLETPRLFASPTDRREVPSDELGLVPRLFEVSPTYVLDLNIMYDLIKNRTNADQVGRIIRASFSNTIRLAVAEEFIKELERTSKSQSTDPMLALALKLPRLPSAPLEQLTSITDHLGSLLFPVQISRGTLRPQDRSDLVHVATAIHHSASGFVTGEKTILRAREVLQSLYSLDVVGPSEFAEALESVDSGTSSEIEALAGGQILRARPLNRQDRSNLEAFLNQLRCPRPIAEDAVRDDGFTAQRRMLVELNDRIVGLGFWKIPTTVNPFTEAFLCVDEECLAAGAAADFLLDALARELPGLPTQLSLRLLQGTTTTKRVAIAHGFRPSAGENPSGTNLRKVALGTIVTSQNWSTVRRQLRSTMKIELPESIPTYHSPSQPIIIRGPVGETTTVSLENLETLLSPAIFVLPHRPAAIVPIKRTFAADLVGGASQMNMLAGPEATLLRERTYFSSRRTSKTLRKGVPILFYESGSNGGRASAVAAARIVRAELIPKDETRNDLLRQGVLNTRQLSNISSADTVAATTIDNLIRFRNPVGLKALRSIGAVDRSNLVTARSLTAEQATAIVNRGIP